VDTEIQEQTKLAAALQQLDQWATKRNGTKRYNPLEPWLREYEGWEELADAFVGFLKKRLPAEWNEQDVSLVAKVVSIDWAAHRLLRSLSDDELATLVVLPYPEPSVRMYMLIRARTLSSLELRQRIFLHFLECDSSDAVRDSAFESIVRIGWDRTEEFAAKLWSTNDEVKRMVVLQALAAANSSLLDRYLEDASSSGQPGLQRLAQSIDSMRKLEN